jgi:hypothetical protein
MTRKVVRTLKKETRKLPVRLTDEEVLETSRKAAAIDNEIRDLENREERLKGDATAAKKQAESLERDRRELQIIVRQGSEDREVEVVTEANMRTGIAREIRTDTREVIRERPLTVEERQGVIFHEEESEEEGVIDVTPPRLPGPRPEEERPDA